MPACCGTDEGPWKPWMSAGLGLVVGLIVMFAIPSGTFFTRSTMVSDSGVSGERWACPMMDFIGTHSGACPVCGMTLQRVTAGELTREQAKRMGVQLVTIESGPAIVNVHAYGAVRYDDRTEQAIVARVAGRIVKRHGGALHPGLIVQVGDPLVDLYSPDVFAAQGELAAAIKLGDQPTIQAITERFARWNLADVAAAIAKGGAPQDTVTIHSPYTGRVIVSEEAEKTGMVKVGTEVMPDRVLLSLTDPAAYMVIIHVPEPQARLIREGQKVSIASDDVGELPDVDARVSWVAPELNPEIRARAIHLHLRDPHHRMLPGSLINARFQAVLAADMTPADPDKPETWGTFPLIPKSAVLSTGVRSIAWKLTKQSPDGRQAFTVAPIALGQRLEDANGNDRWVVRYGLQAGDQVAAQGLFLIDSQAQLAGSASLLFPVGSSAPVDPHAGHGR